jgi:predicted deacylase
LNWFASLANRHLHLRQPVWRSFANVFRDINPVLLQEVDYVVDFHRDRIQETKPSTIIRLHENGEFEVIRQLIA